MLAQEFIDSRAIFSNPVDKRLGEGHKGLVLVKALREKVFGDLFIAHWVQILFEENLKGDFASASTCDHR
jgi:hypothetical protein